MSGASVIQEERDRRLKAAREVAREGGNAKHFSIRAGLKPSAGANWLRKNAPDLHATLTAAGRGRTLSQREALVRLLLLKSVEGIRGGQGRLAKALGLTPIYLATFKAAWAPDGLDAAISDLMPDAGNGKQIDDSGFNGMFPELAHGVAHG